MTAGLPYLRNLRKADLVELAENSKLKNYLDMKKTELEVALDNHLWSNRSKLQSESSLTDYFRRAGVAAAEVAGVTKTPARARARGKIVESSEESPSPITSPTKSTKRMMTSSSDELKRMASSTASYLEPKNYHLPRLEAPLEKISSKFNSMYDCIARFFEETDIASYFRLVREYVGSAWSINTILLMVEFTGVFRNLIPTKQLFDFSRFKLWLFKSPLTAVYTFEPGFFFSSPFWSVSSLWAIIGIIIPLVFAYIFNPTVGANLSTPSGAGTRRRTPRYSGGKTSFDPLIFALARGLVMHFVLRNRGRVMCMDWIWSPSMVEFLTQCLPGGMSWVIVRSMVGVIVSLYEAVLRK